MTATALLAPPPFLAISRRTREMHINIRGCSRSVELTPRERSRLREIEQASFSDPWDQARLSAARASGGQLVIATIGQNPIGFAVCTAAVLTRLAVDPRFRRKGCGSLLVRWIVRKMRSSGRRVLRCPVPDDDLAMQCFLQSLNFRCDQILRGYYPTADTARDAYQMSRAVLD